MADKNVLKIIKDKEMDRKDFLKYSGLVLLSLVGLKAVTALLDENGVTKKIINIPDNSNASRGFGGGKYGV